MSLNRTRLSVAIGLFFLLSAVPCLGQGPLGMQIFAPADVSTFGGEQEPNEGFFFQLDGLYWSLSGPQRGTPIGFPATRTVYYGIHPTSGLDPISDAQVQTNTIDSAPEDDKFSAGNRIEFGRMENRNGWLVSIYQQRDIEQDSVFPTASVVFQDPQGLLVGNVNNNSSTSPPFTPPVFRNLPVTFYNMQVDNSVDTWGVEGDYVHRLMTSHCGGTVELLLGVRYYEFNDNFNVYTGNSPGTETVPSFLAGSSWVTAAQNHVVGPQIGLRWFKKEGRWMFNTEGRFMAGLNNQCISQQVNMGPNLNPGANPDGSYTPFQPQTMSPTTATHQVYDLEFSPAAELRVEGRYQLTQAISFHAGWTGLWMAGIARANAVIDYTVPAMGIDLTNNRQNLLVNGLTIGFDVNR
jgi:hypothetical protein